MKNIKVKNTDELRTAMEAGYTKDEIEIVAQDNTAAIAAARAEGVAEGRIAGAEEGRKAGATDERARLSALLDVTREGFEAEHKAAIEAGTSPADFALVINKAAKDRGITIGAIRKDSNGAQHAAAPDANASTAAAKAGWDKVTQKYGAKAKAA
jgi:hypothetical protein